MLVQVFVSRVLAQELSAVGFSTHEYVADPKGVAKTAFKSNSVRNAHDLNTWAWLRIPLALKGAIVSKMLRNTHLPLLLLYGFSSVVLASTDGLLACLSQVQNLTVVSPNSSSYDTDRLAFNRRFTYKPAAIVYSGGVQDVQAAVQCGASSGTPVVARSGGHSYAAYGIGGQDGALVIDLSKLTNLSLNNVTGEATVQTGVKLGPLAQGLWDQGRRALPHGTCPYVGIGGHTAYGGVGPFSRQAGLLLDRAVRAEVVLANGTVATAAFDRNPDLYWALRGAGPSFGIVTAWTYATLPAPDSIAYVLTLKPTAGDKETIINAFNNFQTFARNALPSWGMGLAIIPDGSNKLVFELSGNFYGSMADFNTSFEPLLNGIPEAELTSQQFSWIEALSDTAGSLSITSPEPADNFYAKSLMVKETVSNSSLANWVDYMYTQGTTSNLEVTWFAKVDVYGGEIARASSNVTSFFNRDAFLTFQFYASAKNLTGSYPSNGLTFVDGMHDALKIFPEAAYPNYIDPTLSADQWQSQYYGSNYARLLEIKGEVDPQNVFRFPQSIGYALFTFFQSYVCPLFIHFN
ncbi:FAD-linked oxidoreductase [Rhizoctonia solani 123E]|uniref:FAD-linked oxidoreductase n=1 Tax=Rhizoctonia solani 123E TaxID=1423351 RepID=A0A074SWR3_9AGAM|nr:FAD-linked oxidoreductase [Rhizoctonia solani 123E]